MTGHQIRPEAVVAKVHAVDAIDTIAVSTTASTTILYGDLPAITLKAVVVDLGGKTDQGQIVMGVLDPWFEILKMLQHNPAIAYEIDWRKWEEMIAGAWQRTGMFDNVELTPRSGDKSRDVIGTKRGHFSMRIVDQVKAYKPGHLVQAEEVRAMVGVLSLEQNLTKGYITTTSDFAPGVWKDDDIKRWVPNKLQPVAGNELLAWLEKLSGSKG